MVSRQPHASASLPPGERDPEPGSGSRSNFGIWAFISIKYHIKILYKIIRIISSHGKIYSQLYSSCVRVRGSQKINS